MRHSDRLCLRVYEETKEELKDAYKRYVGCLAQTKTIKPIGCLRILSHNVYQGFRGLGTTQPSVEAIVKLWREWHVDVIGVQELGFEHVSQLQLNEILSRYGYRLAGTCLAAKIGPRTEIRNGWIVSLALPFALETETIPLQGDTEQDRRFESRCAVVLKIAGFTLYNLHLDVWDRTGNTRAREIRRLVPKLRKTGSIVLGDFNETLVGDYDGQHQQWLKENYRQRGIAFEDGRGLRQLIEFGFRDPFQPKPPVTAWVGKRVDYIFVSPDVNVAGTFRIPSALSDHLAVGMDLRPAHY